MNLRTIQVELEDKPGSLMRAVGLVTAMGANIHSLTVRPHASIQGRACVTLTAELSPRQLDLLLRKLSTLVQVFHARELPVPAGDTALPCHNCREIPPSWTNPPA